MLIFSETSLKNHLSLQEEERYGGDVHGCVCKQIYKKDEQRGKHEDMKEVFYIICIYWGCKVAEVKKLYQRS